jgi:hypothetical protein
MLEKLVGAKSFGGSINHLGFLKHFFLFFGAKSTSFL